MLIWLLVIVVPLPGLYDYCPRFRYWLKFSLYYFWLMGASLLIIPLSLTRPGSVENARLGARMMNPLTRMLGIQWRLKGQTELLRLKRPCIIVANHQSSIDLLGMFHIWEEVGRMAAIAKHSLLYYGPFGIIAYLCGTVFIDRRNLKETTQKINSVGKTLTPDQVKLWVFPEGTRNRDKKLSLLPFKKGAFHVAQTSGLPILPLVFSKHSFLDEHAGVFEVGEGVINVLPMISSEGKSIDQLLEETRSSMMSQITV